MSDAPKMPSEAQEKQSQNFKIDFIDPLFAVAIHIGIVEGLLREHWAHSQTAPGHVNDLANLAMFAAGFWTVVASWLGYHKSIQGRPLEGDARFVLDIVLLALYIFLLVYFKSAESVACIMGAIYFIYTIWDYYKTKEHPKKSYNEGQPVPTLPMYAWRCLTGWLLSHRDSKLIGEIVTFGWAIFFLALIPLAMLSFFTTDAGKFTFASVLILANYFYRHDKGSRGSFVCSKGFRLLIVLMVAVAVARAASVSWDQLIRFILSIPKFVGFN